MRTLHAVGPSEAFVASGIYTHIIDDQPADTSETWSIHQLPDGAQMIRVDDDHRKHDGSSALIEGWRMPFAEGGRIERLDLHVFGGQDAPIKELRASYIVNEGRLSFGRSADKEERTYDDIPLPEDYLLSAKSLIFAGFETDEIATRGVETPVISYVPTLLIPQAYVPVVYPMRATFLKEESLTVGGKEQPARAYQRVNPANGETMHVWLDRFGVLLRYLSEDGRHRAELTQYARRPE